MQNAVLSFLMNFKLLVEKFVKSMNEINSKLKFRSSTNWSTHYDCTPLLVDRLLDPDHGVPAPVEEDVGGGVGLGAGHQLLRRGLDDAVVTVQPGRVAWEQKVKLSNTFFVCNQNLKFLIPPNLNQDQVEDSV